MIISFRTLAFVPRQKSHLEPARLTLHHTCNKCLQVVTTEQLAEHTLDHVSAVGHNGIPSDLYDDCPSEYVTPSASIITEGGDLRGKAL
jgi:hypothetical protein